MNEYLKSLGLYRSARPRSDLHRKAFSRPVELDIEDEIDEYDLLRLGSYDSISLYSLDGEQFRLEATHLDNLSLPSVSNENLSADNISSQMKVTRCSKYSLNPIESLCITTVLQDTKDQFDIIRQSLPLAIKKDSRKHTEIADRFGGQGNRKLIYPNEGPTPVETYYMKLQRICQYLTEILHKTKTEIQNKSTYSVLRETNAAEYKMKVEMEEMLHEDAFNKETLRGLVKAKERIAEVVQEKVSAARVTISAKEGQLHDVTLTAEMEKHFTQRWEETRAGQASYILEGVNEVLKNGVFETRMGIDKEYRVNSEVETYLNMAQSQLTDSLEQWQATYEQELEEMEQGLNEKRIEKEAQLDKYLAMRDLMSERQEEIDQYLAEREETRIRREVALVAEIRNNCAMVIQAWWRAVMKRRRLGPYKKKKKGKKGKKGKGKKKVTVEE